MRKVYIITFILVSFLFYLNMSCGRKSQSIQEGEELAHKYCISCHQFNDPSLLDKKSWSENVLPKMAEFMYVDEYYNPYMPGSSQERVAPGNLFPYEKWAKIVNYYLINAPDSMPARTEVSPVQTGMKQFTTHFIDGKTPVPLTTMVRFDTARQQILFGDGSAGKIFIMNTEMNVLDSLRVRIGVADVHLEKKSTDVVTMGIMKPSDAILGKLVRITGKKETILKDSLQRPVQATYGDLNGDGREDIVLCEFGYKKGALSWLENQGNDYYVKHLLRGLPGAINTEIYDFNKDGKPDIIALMAQADEGVFIYYNEGKGNFREDRVLSFPPVYGSNSMQLCDFNNDGFMDILVTQGDNADFSPVLKPYHGIRLFLNDGKNKFALQKFLPAYGVQKAMAADLDEDGDLDIVSVSFFPDYEKAPEESFLYWENKGNGNYQRYTFDGVTDGRWMTLDVGDMDHDGDKDIILANGTIGFGNIPDTLKQKWKSHPLACVILENMLNKK